MQLAKVLAICLLVRAAAAQTVDDRLRFAPPPGQGAAEIVELEATPSGAGFRWGRNDSAWDTALLAVGVTSSAPDPWIETTAGAASVRQYLDPRAQGLRWLNLSALRGRVAAGQRVQLAAHGAAITPGAVALWRFANRLDLRLPMLVLAPHPDDAEIAAFGLYADRDATVVTVTCGNAGDFTYRESASDAPDHYRLKGWLRAIDSVTVPWQGGIPPARCFNLGYFDARLSEMRRAPDTAIPEMYGPNRDTSVYRAANIGRLLPVTPRTNSWRHLVEDLRTVLAKVRPAIVVAPHPLLDTHGDHQHVALALAEALSGSDLSPRILLYTNHAFQDVYPFGPPGTTMSLPPLLKHALEVQAVYSHPVSPEIQRRKLYALESNHDLRLTPGEQAAAGTPPTRPRRESWPRTPATDYFRRAVRACEVFVVADRAGMDAIVTEWLKRAAVH